MNLKFLEHKQSREPKAVSRSNIKSTAIQTPPKRASSVCKRLVRPRQSFLASFKDLRTKILFFLGLSLSLCHVLIHDKHPPWRLPLHHLHFW
uniref:Uncharacterized protein n=1 Tax=Rhizophora mucronata TaxID=61149 RepID=A0A2P2J8E9_RHIMU